MDTIYLSDALFGQDSPGRSVVDRFVYTEKVVGSNPARDKISTFASWGRIVDFLNQALIMIC